MIKYLVIGIILIIVIFVGLSLFQKQNVLTTQNQPVTNQPQEEQNESYGGYGFKKPFYEKDGVSLQHYWPGEGSFSSEETEIIVLNEGNAHVQINSFDMTYAIEDKSYPQKSGTWEKFPSKQSWNKIEYLNISPQYYKSEPLILTPGQKGKLHWHIQFGPNPLDGKQTVTVKLILLKDNETITVDEQFNRDSGSVFSKDNH